jgi:ankyrin repeat protein
MTNTLKLSPILTLLIALPLAAVAQGSSSRQNPDAALFDAISREDAPALRAALGAGASLNAVGPLGHFPLIAAASQGDDDLVKILLDAGADVNAQDRNKHSALTQAAFDNQADVVRVLLTRKLNLDLQDAIGKTAIFYAANRTNLEILDLLLNAGASLSIVDIHGHTVLSQTYMDNNPDGHEVAARLLAAGARFANPTDELYADAATGNIEDLNRMLDAGADPNFKPKSGGTPLCVAAVRGNTVAVNVLLSRGADPKLDDGSQQQTPLFYALVSGHRSTVDTLLDASADPLVRTAGKRTLLFSAANFMDDPEILDRFVRAGVNINESDFSKQTPLMVAAQAGHFADVKYLLDHGGDPTLQDKDGRAAADLAYDRRQDDSAKLLARAEAKWKATHARY